MKKRLLSLFLVAFLILTDIAPVITVAAEELGTPDPVLVQQEFTVSAEDDGVTNAELYNYYAQRLFDEALGIESPSVWSTSVLQEGTLEKELYDAVVPELKKIAAGTVTSASITVNPSKTWTKEDLGVTGEFISGSSLTPEANAGIGEKLNLIYNCLLADCPLELYWHDKVRVGEVGGVEFGMSGISPSGDGLSFGSIIFNFTVAADYRPVDAANVFTTDAAKTGAASAAVAYAETIVAANASKSNLEKLAAYKDAICELVSYDSAAAESSIAVAGVDHWQMVYVFDQNAATNVVCEGYAKAFQYLCDLSTFTGGVECHTVTGVMSGGTGAGGHMWNVVTMDDGKNYLVDVTNCDSGTIGAPDKLFIAHTANSANANRTHTFAVGGSSISFTYDAEMEDLFCEGYLALSTTVYSPPPEGNIRTTPITTWDFEEDTSGDGWVWDHETSTLTITDLTIDLSEYAFDDAWCAISLEEGTLVSAGSGNKIIAPADFWEAIDFYGACTITGDAPLTIETEGYYGISSEDGFSLTIDGTPISIAAAEGAIGYADSVTLNGGSHIATAGVKIGVYDNYYATVKDGELAPNAEIAVADEYIEQTTIPEALYAGKANDSAMSVTLTVGAVVVGSSDPLTYQWYSCDDYNGANPVAVADATSASYTFSGSLEAEEYYFFCRATAGTLTRDFPVSKVVLTASGTLTVEHDLHLYYSDPTIDRLNTYGYKWEPSTLTLTLKNADIRGQLSIYADGENPGDITINLAEGSVNSVTRESSYGVLYGSGNYNSDFIITGAGTLNVSRSGSDNATYGVVSNGGETLIISGGAQVNVNNSRPMSVVKCTVDTPVLQVCDTAKLTVNNTTPDVDVTDRAYAVGNYNVLKRTKITTPADYTTEVSGNVTFVKDAAGYATKVVFERDTTVYLDFEQYPQASISTPSGQNTVLTASAVLYNYAEAYTVAYQWYLDGEAIDGATSASYTFAPTEVDLYTLRCDASVTAGGKDYAITGEDITVKYGFYTGSMSFSPSTASVDHLDTYGWKWDNATATLTLNGAYIDNGSTGLKISGFTAETPFKIVLAEGSHSILYGGSSAYAMDISDYALITGTGTLELRGTGLSSLYGRNGSHLTVAGGAQVVINHQTRANGKSSEPLNFTGSGVLWLEDEGTKLTVNPVDDKSCSLHIARFDSCKKAQMEHYFLLSGPANPHTDYRGYLCDGSKTYRGQLVLTANLTTRPIFNQYPMLKYSVEKNTAVTLTAGAKMLNYTGASPTISYQWYLGNEAIDGATNASYTFTPTEASVSGLRCDATITAGGNTYTLTGSSILVLCEAYEEQLILNDTTASVDKLDAYGYKWDLDTKTLTLDGFAQCSAGANASLNVMTDLTIVLAEGSVNTLNSSTYDGIFITNGKTLTVTGNGKLIANSFAPAAADHHGLNMYSGSKIIVQNGAKVELNTLGLIGVDGSSNNTFVLSDKDSYLSATAAEGGKAFYLKTPIISDGDFVVKEPAGGKLLKNGSYVTSVDSTDSPVNHCVLKGDDNVRFNFAQYPAENYTLTKGNTLPLTATAALTNYDGSATISYQWYLNGEAIADATAATYTFAPSEAGLYTLRCDASTTVDETLYSVTGEDIAVSYDVYPHQIALGNTTASVDNLDEYGWKWDLDTKKLTLDGLNQAVKDTTNSLYITTDVTIVLEEGSVNTFNSAQSTTLFIQSGASVTVTGEGVLQLLTSSTSKEAIHLNPNAKLLVQGGAVVSATTLASDCVASASGISIKVKDEGSSFSATAKTGGRAFALYQPAINPGDFMVQTPAGGHIKNGSSVDSEGNYVNACVLVADPAVYLVFDEYPALKQTGTKGTPMTLSASTELLNYTGAATTVTYQWYLDGKAIDGATNSTYTFTPSAKAVYTLRCDAATTVEIDSVSTPLTATGQDISVNTGALTGLDVRSKASTDKLATEGWKWDRENNTLTLKDFVSYGQLDVPARATIVLMEGSENYIRTTNAHNIVAYNYGPTLTGGGKLTLEQTLTGTTNYAVISAGGGDYLNLRGVKLEVIRHGGDSITSGALLYTSATRFFFADVSIRWDGDHSTKPMLTTNTHSYYGCVLETGNGNYGVYDADSDCTVFKVTPKGIYFSPMIEEETVYGIGLGESVTLNAPATSVEGKPITYTWYATDDYSNPAVEDSTVMGTNSTLTVKGTERGGKYYYCVATDGENTITSNPICVVTAAKGKLPITEAIDTDETVDALATHGYKWDSDTKTLTLDNAEIFLPFTSSASWFTVDDGYTIALAAGSVNNTNANDDISIYIRFTHGMTEGVTFTGAGVLYPGGFAYPQGPITFTDGITVYSDRFSTESGRTNDIVVEDGAFVAGEGYFYINGTVTVENGTLIAKGLINQNNDGSITINDGGLLEVYDDVTGCGTITVNDGGVLRAVNEVESYGDMTVAAGGALYANNVQVGYNSAPYGAVTLTVGGLLSASTEDGRPLTIYTTKDKADAFKLSGSAALLIPDKDSYVLPDVAKADKTFYFVDKETSFNYNGALLIAPADSKFTPLSSIAAISGTAAYGETLTAGAVSPAGATARYEWEFAPTKDGPWKSIGYNATNSTYTIAANYSGCFLRVKAIGTGLYTGEVYSAAVGPVKGDPTMLRALYIDKDLGWDIGELDGSLISLGTQYVPVDYRENNAIPVTALLVNEDATITMAVSHESDPDTVVTYDGAVTELLLDVGMNTILITVTYGEQVREYTFRVSVYMREYYFYLRNYAEGTTLYATLDYTEEDRPNDTVSVADGDPDAFVDDVPYDTEITLTADTPVGMRLWSYGSDDLMAAQDEDNTCTYIFRDHVGSIYINDYSLVAEAPQIRQIRWADDGYGKVAIELETLKRPDAVDDDSNYDDHFDISVEVIDNITGERVDLDSAYTTCDGEPNGAGDNQPAKHAILGLDPHGSYTFRFCYELAENHSDMAANESQYATFVLNGVSGGELTANSDHIVLLLPGSGEVEGELSLTNTGNVASEIEVDWSALEVIANGATVEDDDIFNYFDVYPDYGKPGTFTLVGKQPCTAWITFRVLSDMIANEHAVFGYDSVYAYTTVRVDVSDAEDPTGTIHLGETTGSLNLFDDSTLTIPVHNMDCGKPITGAAFTNAALNDIFDIEVVNDRTLRVIPKEKALDDTRTYAEWGKALSGTHTAKICVEYSDGDQFRNSEEALTIKLTAKAPSVKATAVKFNSFYVGQTLPLEFTTKDGVVDHVVVDETKATTKTPACPDWLTLNDDMTVTLNNGALTANKGSGKLNVEVWLEGFRAPAQVAVSVSAAYTAPKLKLSTATISLPAVAEDLNMFALTLLSGDKNIPLEDLDISNVRVATTAEVMAMNAKDRATYAASGSYEVYSLDTGSGLVQIELADSDAVPAAGKILLLVSIGEESLNQVIQLPVTVKLVAAPTFKLSKSSINLNTTFGTYEDYTMELALTSSASGFDFADTEYQILDSKGNPVNQDALNVSLSAFDGTVTVGSTAGTEATTYKVRFTDSAVAKAVDLTVKVVNTAPKLKLSTSSVTINRLMGPYTEVSVGITSADALYDGEFWSGNTAVKVYDAAGDPVAVSFFTAGISGSPDPAYRCMMNLTTQSELKVGTYKAVVTHTMPDETTTTSATVTIKVVDKHPSLKVDNKNITLVKGVTDNVTIVNISGMEDFYTPYRTYTVNGEESSGEIWVSGYGAYGTDTLGIELGSNAEVGKTYKVNISLCYNGISGDPVYSKPIALTVKVVDGITGTVTAKGNMDPIRPDTTATDFTFKYSGFAPRVYNNEYAPTLEWYVVAMNGKVPVAESMGAWDALGTVARGEICDNAENNTTESGSWFTNVSEDPYGMKLMLNTEDGGAWSEGQVNPKYTYNVHFKLVVPAAATDDGNPVEYPLGKPVKITLKQGSSKFAADVKEVTLSKLDPYGRAMVELYSTDKDAVNLSNIAKVTADGTTFDVKKVGNKYAIYWKDNEVPANAKSGTVKLNIWLKGNSSENKPNATVSVKVNVK